MVDQAPTEVTPAYRTLDEPTKLLGLSVAQWGALALAGAIAYGWLLVSPLPWRMNASLVVIGAGGPLIIALLREQGALTAPQLFRAVWRWRVRPALLLAADPATAAGRGGVVLDEAGGAPDGEQIAEELPWLDPPSENGR
jgi:hypothetical protein